MNEGVHRSRIQNKEIGETYTGKNKDLIIGEWLSFTGVEPSAWDCMETLAPVGWY